ncbi:MAG TPA: Fe-S cluster assembly protein SufB [Patescibacteria group bacterium]
MSHIFDKLNRETFDHKNKADYAKTAQVGLTENLVRQISAEKNEPRWMLDIRLKGLELFDQLPLPDYGPDLSQLEFDKIIYYAKPADAKNTTSWDEVPEDIKQTFEKLGIPEAERQMLAGAGAQYEAATVYHNLKEQWTKQGVIFEDMDTAVQKYPDLVKKHYMKQCVPVNLHKFTALHAAVWSGGTFLYIPKGVKVDQPMQAYFRMNAKNMGQFEHTLIIIENEAEGHYIEGCSAPKYGSSSLHAGCVEIFVGDNARFRYSSVENWSRDTYNLNTKRSLVGKNSFMEWVGGNLGSGVTMLYPCSVLKGEGGRADHLGIAFAGPGQNQDTGAKVIHAAPRTTSNIVMKSLSKGDGLSVYRGLVHVAPQAENAKVNVNCDALLLSPKSKSDTIPVMNIQNPKTQVAHEATTGKISEDKIFYLMSRGLSEGQAQGMVVNGFIEPIIKELPLEYAVEMNRLISLEMEGSVG